MSSIYYLYLKTHNITGLKYVGQTTQNPKKYTGSGTYWLRHLEKHGNDVSTKVLGQYSTKEELKEAGLYFSKLWNIVESTSYANLAPEEGLGGFTWKKGKTKETDIRIKKQAEAQKGIPHSEERKRNIALNHHDVSGSNNPMYGKKFSKEQCKKISEKAKGRIPWNKGKTMPFKGRTYEEMYGIEKALELKKLRSENNYKKKLATKLQ